MIHVHNEVPGGQARRLGQCVRCLSAPRCTDYALAEDVLFGDDRYVVGHVSSLERQNDEPELPHLERYRLLPAIQRLDRLEAVVLEHLAHAVARAFGPAGDDGFTACPRLSLDARDDRFKKVCIRRLPFSREVRRNLAAAIDDRQALVRGHEGR